MDITSRLIEKSQEAFIVAIELYNKPTIKYRVEGFTFFICNAWELMLKSYLITKQGENSIYYSDNPNRTISLEKCIQLIFTNNKDPLRINLEKIIELRNICTHFITEEYEQIYAPLFQSCVINYSNKLLEFFDVDITDKIPQNFLTLSIKLDRFSPETIQARYPKEIAEKLLLSFKNVEQTISSVNNSKLSILIEHSLIITKNPKMATASFSISKNAEHAAYILKEEKDMHKTHPFNLGEIIKHVNSFIKKEKIELVTLNNKNVFNKYHFNLFNQFYNIKQNPTYSYAYPVGSNTLYAYSQKLINFITEEIKKDPNGIISNLKLKVKNK